MKIRVPKTEIIEVDVPENVIIANTITLLRKKWDLPEGVYQSSAEDNKPFKLMIEVEYHTSHSYFDKEVYRKVTSEDAQRLAVLEEMEAIKKEYEA